LTRKAAAARLSYPTLVLVSSDGKMVPNYYTWLFQPGTLVVVPGSGPAPYVGHREETSSPAFEYPGNGPPPVLRFASVDARGTVRLRQYAEKQEYQTARVQRADGDGEVQLRQIMRRTQITQVPLAHVQVFRGSGDRLDSQGLRRLLPREMTVLVSADGQPLHPFWLRNIKLSALILAHPVPMIQEAYPRPYGPRPQEHIMPMPQPAPPPPAST
jgi:hypothetical protein